MKAKKKIDVPGTIARIPVGEKIMFKTKDVKATTVRSAVRRLNKRGYSYTSTERGLINEIAVIRTK